MMEPNVAANSNRAAALVRDVLDAAPHAGALRRQSGERLAALAAALQAELAEQPVHVAISGSWGRLEARPSADADVIVIVDDDASAADARRLHARVLDIAAQHGLAAPRTRGVFAQAVRRWRLTSLESVGLVAEDPACFGPRMQLLLDARPLVGANHHALLTAIVARGEQVSAGDAFAWSYLWHDLARYHHALAVAAAGREREQPARRCLRLWKFRFSRLAMGAALAGLLLVTARLAEREVRRERLLAGLAATPLERLAWLFAVHDDAAGYARAVAAYDEHLAAVSDEHFRGNPFADEHQARLRHLDRAADTFATELHRLLARLRDELPPSQRSGLLFY